MWICKWCGRVFDEPTVSGGVKRCPVCLDTKIEEHEPQAVCECCGREALYVNEQGVCSWCAARLNNLWEAMVIDAILITHKSADETEAFLKKYFMELWRDKE